MMRHNTKNTRFAKRCIAAALILGQIFFPTFVTGQINPSTTPASGNSDKLTGSGMAGIITTLSGSVFIRTTSGTIEPARIGDVFSPNTNFITGPDGSVGLAFADGQNVSLNKDSTLSIGDYRYDPSNALASKSNLQLVSGTMSVVTGEIQNRNASALSFSAGSASVNILSKGVTAFVVEVDPNSKSVGTIAVSTGEIGVNSPTGSIANIAANQFVRWLPGVAPLPPQPIASAPAVLQAAITATKVVIFEQINALQSTAAGLVASGLNNIATSTTSVVSPATTIATTLIVPTVTPASGGGCVGSPC